MLFGALELLVRSFSTMNSVRTGKLSGQFVVISLNSFNWCRHVFKLATLWRSARRSGKIGFCVDAI